MNISCTPRGIVDIKHPHQGVRDIAAAGFEGVLLTVDMACPPGELEIVGKSNQEQDVSRRTKKPAERPEELGAMLQPMLERCVEARLSCPVAMAPYLRRNTKRDDLNELIVRLAEESIELCGRIGCPYLIVRPLFAGIPKEKLWEENRVFYLRLAERTKNCKVQILLENQCKDLSGHLVRGICTDGVTAAKWVDKLNNEAGEERFGFCMDVGACNLCAQNMYELIMSLDKRLKAVILRDCNGNTENALLPFTSINQGQIQTDWLNLIRGLRETEFDGELIMDLGDTAAVFSPILRPELVKLAKSVALYFKWQIEIERMLQRYPSRVLFGAGNMCRNYMKCYGEKYPPLYTCDNNRQIWETSFCGLTVKSPDELKKLPKDCAIFICNIYYREIAEQLRGMGIKNPIEFFNDEYMPTFYFDRLKERG